MRDADSTAPSSPTSTYMLVPILLLFVLLIIAVLRAPNLISSAGIGSAIIVAAPLILATYALTIIAMAGRAGVDLSIGPLLGFINVSMIQLFAAEVISTPVQFFAYAIAVGILYQVLMGLIIVFVRVQPIIVALSGYLALVGLNLVILPRPGGVAPEWLMPWGLGTSILSPVLAILVLATVAWFFLNRTAFFGHLRLMGADERTAYSSGVRIGIVRIGAHAIAGVYSALAAITFTALISSGDPTQGTTYTLMAVTALVLGGTSLAGGRGTIIGSLLGALNIYLITYVLSTFSFGMVQSFVTELAYGVVLVISLLLTLVLPRLPLAVRSISPFSFFVLLGVIALGVVLHARDEVIAPAPDPATAGLSVPGSDSGLTVLGGDDTSSGLTVLGGDDASSGLTVLGDDPGDSGVRTGAGTALVVSAIIALVVLYLLYLLYRHASVSLVGFVAVVILLVLGVTLYDRDPALRAGGHDRPVTSVEAADSLRLGRVFYFASAPRALAAEEAPGGSSGSLFSSPLAYSVLIAVGAILFGSLLVFLSVHHVRTRVGDLPLALYLGIAALVCAVVVYAYDDHPALSDTFYAGALGAVVVGALLFFITLPPVQARFGNISQVMIAAIALAAVASTYFAAGSVRAPQDAAPRMAPRGPAPDLMSGFAERPDVVFSEAFQVQVFWVILTGVVLFLVTLPRAWPRVLTYISFDQGMRSLSYIGVFIVMASILGLGALFYAAQVPLWKLGVTVVAALIGARFAWRFLGHYRRRGNAGATGSVVDRGPSVREMLGVER